jgi:hypothetical protein
VVWAYGFTLVGAASALGVGMLVSAAISSAIPAKPPAFRVETYEHIRPIQ